MDLASTRVPASALAAALGALAPDLRAALEETIRRVRLVHEAQRPADAVTHVADGATVTERYVAVGRAGVYVPGGLVTYPSSVLMNVVPAQVAGVPRIAVASPPQRDGACPRRLCWRPARCSASRRYTPLAGPRPSPCSATAPPTAPRWTS